MKIFLLMIIISSLHAAETTKAKKSNTYIDRDGDEVVVLDADVRAQIKAAKRVNPDNIYDNRNALKKFKKNFLRDILTRKSVRYGAYMVVEGDDLKKISQKLYETPNHWYELLILNEDSMKSSIPEVGIKLKYIIDDKLSKKVHPRQFQLQKNK